jgi:hypothetical protein
MFLSQNSELSKDILFLLTTLLNKHLAFVLLGITVVALLVSYVVELHAPGKIC